MTRQLFFFVPILTFCYVVLKQGVFKVIKRNKLNYLPPYLRLLLLKYFFLGQKQINAVNFDQDSAEICLQMMLSWLRVISVLSSV